MQVLHNPTLPLKPKKIGFLISTDITVGAGIENVVIDFIENKINNFEPVLIQTNYFDHKRLDKYDYIRLKKSTEVRELPVAFSKIKRVCKNLGIMSPYVYILLLKIYKIVYGEKIKEIFKDIDVVYLGTNALYSLVPNKIAIIGSQHDGLYLQSKHRLLNILKIKFINSKFLYRRIALFHIFPGVFREEVKLEKPFFKLPPRGVKDSFKSIKTKREGDPRFLFVSRLTECKGVKFILDLWIKSNFNYRLDIVGEGPLSDHIRNIERNNIVYHGKLKREELEELYTQADFFLAPTQCDIFPMVVIEAMSKGCYPIISDLIGPVFREFFSEEFISSVPLQLTSWTVEIKKCITNISEIRSKTSEKIVKLVSNEFNAVNISQKFYNEILKQFN